MPHSLDGITNVSFVMFLACEVGGSKFMQDTSGNTQLDIIANNIRIYQTVFEYVGQENTQTDTVGSRGVQRCHGV